MGLELGQRRRTRIGLDQDKPVAPDHLPNIGTGGRRVVDNQKLGLLVDEQPLDAIDQHIHSVRVVLDQIIEDFLDHDPVARFGVERASKYDTRNRGGSDIVDNLPAGSIGQGQVQHRRGELSGIDQFTGRPKRPRNLHCVADFDQTAAHQLCK